jgi:serine/threonine-protein kinase
MTETSEQMIHTCAKCGTQTEEQQAVTNEYKCSHCDYELAHLDMAANGAVRGVFGWLKETQTEIGGRYLVETVLGKGGFGATYLVKDQRVQGKRWALKEIPEILFDEYEVTLLSQLDHPSVPIIVDRFTDDGMVYLVLKFGGTKTLATECKQHQKIAYKTLKPWIIQLADVLNYLHNRNPPIIHRDLKPENILIDTEDRIMLIDFGIAKESVAETVTRTLGRAASHGFSPPEQVMGTGTDVRSDVYSFAATIYFALVGKSPVAAHERVAGAVLQAASELVTGIPVEADVMLTKALNLNINERPQTIAEFLTAFTGVSPVVDDTEQASKTVQISDIQFGPVVNEKLSRSTPLAQQAKSSTQQKSKSRLNAIIIGILVVSSLAVAGVSWFISNNSDDSKKGAPIATAPQSSSQEIKLTPEHAQQDISNTTTDPSNQTPEVSQQDTNSPSALDILMQKRENQKSVETQIADDTSKVDTAAKTQSYRKREANALRAKKERERKASIARSHNTAPSSKKPNWGNQPKGTF